MSKVNVTVTAEVRIKTLEDLRAFVAATARFPEDKPLSMRQGNGVYIVEVEASADTLEDPATPPQPLPKPIRFGAPTRGPAGPDDD